LVVALACAASSAKACDVVIGSADCEATAVAVPLVVLPQAALVAPLAVQEVRLVPLAVEQRVIVQQRVVRQRVRILGRRRAVQRLAACY
jgi:hypothetical protein